MTTKWKIIVGFVVMVAIVGMIAVLGYSGVDKSSSRFTEYRRLARLNVATSDLENSLHAASSNIYAFIVNEDEKLIIETKKNIESAIDSIKRSEDFITDDDMMRIFVTLKAEMITFDNRAGQVRQSIKGTSKQYRSVLLPDARALTSYLDKMGAQAENTGNTPALANINRAWSALTMFMSGVSRFANTYAKEDALTVRAYIADIQKAMEFLDQSLESEAGRNDIAELNRLFSAMTASFAAMENLSENLRVNLENIISFMEETTKKTYRVSEKINNDMVSYGTATLQANKATQSYLLVSGSAGFVFGSLIALFIVLGFIKVLAKLSNFASAVAKGDFACSINNKEKGEIGRMIESMRQIPAVLDNIIATANSLANTIRSGRLRERFDTKTLPGTFSNLGIAVNTVSAAYTELIDTMPIPLMTCDKNFNILFFNTIGQSLAKSDVIGKPCKNELNAAVCGTGKCVGRIAMDTNAPATAETSACPAGLSKEVAITAVPLRDADGKPSGYAEFMTDLTEIKKQQATMQQVASDASTISDRVAAAAEELAAQVEEISRGAEMQREQVISTASAMNEMNSTVLEVARNAGQASEQSEEMRTKAENGALLVNKVVQAVHRVHEVGGKLHENMQELGKQAQSIGGVMNVISDIADQTNLLALNAAIEAARAGEAGRGFAVVADEVRKLAEKTMEATQEVGGNITAIQQSARVNIAEVDRAVVGVSEATDLANSSGEALNEILLLATANSSVVASIATAAEEQSATSDEINRAVDEINKISGETTDGMIQSSEAVQELSRMAQELRRVMEGLR